MTAAPSVRSEAGAPSAGVPPAETEPAAPAPPAVELPTPVGAATVMLISGTQAEVDILIRDRIEPDRLRAAIAALQEGTDWQIERLTVEVERLPRLDPQLPAPRRLYASFTLRGSLFVDGANLPVRIFAPALREFLPFSCTFMVPEGLHGQAPFDWRGAEVGAVLRENRGAPGEFTYYIADHEILARLDPPDPLPPAPEPAPAGPSGGTFLPWVLSGILIVGGGIMVRLYVVRRAVQTARGGRDGSRKSVPTRR